VVWFEARETKRDMSGVANEIVLVVTIHPINVQHVRNKERRTHASGKDGGAGQAKERRGCRGGAVAQNRLSPPAPHPSTLIPLSGVFDQELTTSLCDSYHEYAAVGPDLLRAGGGNCRLFSM